MRHEHTGAIEAQRRLLLDAIGELEHGATSYALLDFPNHSNVGDSAIWLGEIAVLKSIFGRGPAYVSTLRNFNAAEFMRRCPDGPIFIHGGGNFGDIWNNHQRFRERLLRNYRNRPIIQLAQTIKFHNPANAESCARLISSHRNFTVFVRDEQSLEFATERFECPARLIPDGAFGLGALAWTQKPAHEVVLLLRTDHERQQYDLTPFEQLDDAITVDWLEEPKSLSRKVAVVLKVQEMFGLIDPKEGYRLTRYNWVASRRVDRGLKTLSDGRFVITDRLHAHILCFLLGVPHVTLDNNYGKVSGYMEAWNTVSPYVDRATSPTDAVEKLARLKDKVAHRNSVEVELSL